MGRARTTGKAHYLLHGALCVRASVDADDDVIRQFLLCVISAERPEQTPDADIRVEVADERRLA